jgi:hypothetical protein
LLLLCTLIVTIKRLGPSSFLVRLVLRIFLRNLRGCSHVLRSGLTLLLQLACVHRLARCPSCLEPIREPVLVDLLAKDVVVQEIVLDDRVAKIFGGKANTEFSMCSSCA